MAQDRLEKPHAAEQTPANARQGAVSGRIALLLTVSLALALVAVVAVLGYVYSTYSGPPPH